MCYVASINVVVVVGGVVVVVVPGIVQSIALQATGTQAEAVALGSEVFGVTH